MAEHPVILLQPEKELAQLIFAEPHNFYTCYGPVSQVQYYRVNTSKQAASSLVPHE